MMQTILNLKGKHIYSIEGNIKAGKTRILNIIGRILNHISFIEETISKW